MRFNELINPCSAKKGIEIPKLDPELRSSGNNTDNPRTPLRIFSQVLDTHKYTLRNHGLILDLFILGAHRGSIEA